MGGLAAPTATATVAAVAATAAPATTARLSERQGLLPANVSPHLDQARRNRDWNSGSEREPFGCIRVLPELFGLQGHSQGTLL